MNNLVWIFPLTWFNFIFAWLKLYQVWITAAFARGGGGDAALFSQSVFFLLSPNDFLVKIVFVCHFGFIVSFFFISWQWLNMLLAIRLKCFKSILYLDELCKNNTLEWNAVTCLLSYLFHLFAFSKRSGQWAKPRIKVPLNQNIRCNWNTQTSAKNGLKCEQIRCEIEIPWAHFIQDLFHILVSAMPLFLFSSITFFLDVASFRSVFLFCFLRGFRSPTKIHSHEWLLIPFKKMYS